MGLSTFEKVILLQDVDMFSSITTDNLAHLAQIAEELDVAQGTVLFREGDASDAMFIVIQGHVLLHQGDTEVLSAEEKSVFGTWALFDDQPRVVTATVVEDSSLLKIEKDDFYELLSDHIQITQSIIQAITARLRNLMQRVGV